MPDLLAPGVFVEEVSFRLRPIEGGNTAVTCFFGHIGGHDAPLQTPVFITSMAEFVRVFCDRINHGGDPFAAALRGFFDNGGAKVYVVRLNDDRVGVTSTDLDLIGDLSDINLIAAPSISDAASHEAMITHCEGRHDRFAVLDSAPDAGSIGILTTLAANGGARPRNADWGVAAVYTPWIDVANVTDGSQMRIGPSGHICGMFARSDVERGVAKSIGNTTVRGVLGLAETYTDADMGELNQAHVNPLRILPNRGPVVWGARTLAGNDGEYKYVPVRRFLNFVTDSIGNGTRWAVFEPNDEALWSAVQQSITQFLGLQWRAGALAGAKASDAFFVELGQATMTQADIDSGRLIVQIGIAPVRPAEFIVLRITQTKSGFAIHER